MITVVDVTREGNYITDIPELYHDQILMRLQCPLQLHFILDFVWKCLNFYLVNPVHQVFLAISFDEVDLFDPRDRIFS